MRSPDREPTDHELAELSQDVHALAESWARRLSIPTSAGPMGRGHVDLVRALGALTTAIEDETARRVAEAREAGVGDRRLGAAWGISKQGAAKKWPRPSTAATPVAPSAPPVGVQGAPVDPPSVDSPEQWATLVAHSAASVDDAREATPSASPPLGATTVAPSTRVGTARAAARRARLHTFTPAEVERLELVGEREADGGTVWRAMLDGRVVGRVEHAWRGARRTGWQAVPADSPTPVYRAGTRAGTREQALIDLAEHLVRVGLTRD
ncbi:hypothetical protein [Embleya sp. MST-111070]|uniref:hypothetical protein n=1 Tax=Embleya sp. MST-111070 TaxID=3398231 RepID=UPI003F7376FB